MYNEWVKSWTPQTERNQVFQKEWVFPAPHAAPVVIHDYSETSHMLQLVKCQICEECLYDDHRITEKIGLTTFS